MGKEQLLALAEIIRQQIENGTSSPINGTWTIEYNKDKNAFYFGKCEFGGYCEERPALRLPSLLLPRRVCLAGGGPGASRRWWQLSSTCLASPRGC
jgi:hypothetical protein